MSMLWEVLILMAVFGAGYEVKQRIEPWIKRKLAYKRRAATRRAKKAKGGENA